MNESPIEHSLLTCCPSFTRGTSFYFSPNDKIDSPLVLPNDYDESGSFIQVKFIFGFKVIEV
jgi:hypothetical protein